MLALTLPFLVLLPGGAALGATAPAPPPHGSGGCPNGYCRNMSGVTVPAVLPADAAGTFSLLVRGSNFGTPSNQPADLRCRLKTPDSEQPRSGPIGPAIVLNNTHVRCTELGGYLTGGQFGVAVESPSNSVPSKHIWWSHGTSSAEYRNFLEVTPGRRPYLSDELMHAELMVAVNLGAIRMYPPTADAQTLTVCAELTSKRGDLFGGGANPYLPAAARLDPSLEGLVLLPCTELKLATLAGGFNSGDARGAGGLFNTSIFAIPLDGASLRRIPASVPAARLRITATVGKSFALRPKYRRFAVAASSGVVANQSVTTVCHRRRAVRFNGEPWLGVGFYVAGAVTQYQQRGKGAPPVVQVPIPTPHLAKRTFTDMARQNLNWIMPYGLDSLNTTDRAEIVAFLDDPHEGLNSTVKFDMALVPEVVRLLNATSCHDPEYTAAWSDLVRKVDSVRHSPSLLSYYICDDCDNAQAFPPEKMAYVWCDLTTLSH